MDHDSAFWSVLLTARTSQDFDPWATRDVLEQSDVGGDIERLSAAPGTVSLRVRTWAPDEALAYGRVVRRVKDVLGSTWTVERHDVVALQEA